MEIKINQEQLDEAVSLHINKAVESALSGYDIQRSISEKISNEVACGIIGESVSNALQALDTKRLTTALAEQIQRTMTGAVCGMIEEGIINLIMDMRKVPSYDDEKRKRAYAEIKESLSGGRNNIG